MVFNGASNGYDICTLADYLVKTDDTDFELAQKALFASMGEREILSWIYSVYGGWIYDDSNQTDLPQATTNLVSGQVDYALPSVLSLKGVSVKLDGSDSWQKLTQITLEEIQDKGYAEPEFERIAGNPMYYRPLGNSIKLYPAANYSQDDSIQIEFDRDAVGFDAADTTQTPGFNSLYHEAVAVFMAMMYAELNTMKSATSLRKQWDGNEEVTKVEGGFKKRIKEFYRTRFAEKQAAIIPNGRRDVVGDYM